MSGGMDDDDVDEVAAYWIPDDDEEGLTEVMATVPEDTRVYLHSRPVGELEGNFTDYTGNSIRLTNKVFVEGKTSVLRDRAKSMHDGSYYSREALVHALLSVSQEAFVLARYRDYSRWASRNYPREAAGGFGSPTELRALGFETNPFARWYVDRYYAVAVEGGPGYFKPLSKRQFLLGVAKCHANSASGTDFLVKEQFDEILSVSDEPASPSARFPAMAWSSSLDLSSWPVDQKVSTASLTALCVVGAFLGVLTPVAAASSSSSSSLALSSSDKSATGSAPAAVVLRKSALWGFVGTLFWAAVGMFSSLVAAVLAERGPRLPAFAPVSGLFAAAMALSLGAAPPAPRARALCCFSLIATFANYRIVVYA
ncbi:hypothetical protein DIPPA_25760 [Diplonema papillatum]|nr:hypothetical protein DIPPA_25760 [Diplonema papillatum]|eukprot:gene16517-25331_t